MARKLTYEEVKNFIEVKSDSRCKLLSKEYLGNKSKLKIQCKCGNEFETTFNNFKSSNKRQCGECSGKIEWTFNKVKKFIEQESNSKCKLLSGNYIASSDKMILQCVCGDIFYVRFNDFYSKNQRQCQKCGHENGANERRFSYDQVKNYIEVESRSDCKLLSKKYSNCESKILLQCKCGSKFKTTFSEFKYQNKHQCNLCSKSIGETRIEKWLIKNKIDYNPEYSFENCLSEKGNLLRFDFYLLKLNICIEYDGEGHYYPFRFSKDKDKMKNKLKETQINDNIKNQYCKNNNIPLLRIPYWEFDNTEQILEEWLENRGVIHKNKGNIA